MESAPPFSPVTPASPLVRSASPGERSQCGRVRHNFHPVAVQPGKAGQRATPAPPHSPDRAGRPPDASRAARRGRPEWRAPLAGRNIQDRKVLRFRARDRKLNTGATVSVHGQLRLARTSSPAQGTDVTCAIGSVQKRDFAHPRLAAMRTAQGNDGFPHPDIGTMAFGELHYGNLALMTAVADKPQPAHAQRRQTLALDAQRRDR